MKTDLITSHASPLLIGLFGLLAVDLLITLLRPRPMGRREAALWTVVWIGVAIGFWALLARTAGPARGLEFFTGYVIEKALSVDNLFVFMVLMATFAPPPAQRQKVLAIGILLAIALRGVFIFAGVALIERFHFLIYGFGALLLWTGLRLLRPEAPGQEDSAGVRWLRRIVPSTPLHHGGRYLVWERGRPLATPLGLLLLCIMFTDVVFAIDSIPAVMAVTRDPIVILSANVLALLGLRALFFLLGDLLHRFHYLRPAMALLLSFVGFKMIMSQALPIPIPVSLSIIALLLGGAVIASVLRDRRSPAAVP